MPIARISITGVALLLLVACGGPDARSAREQAAADAEAAELGRDTDKTVFDDLVQTQDKARAVEDVTLGHKANLDAAMEQAEGSTAVADE